ncbi:MAG: AMP-binding protein [Clostridiaceae bacterium]|nr:AMP-binding protein [Clostridiaceae bacterium]
MSNNAKYPLYETTVFEDFRIMTENVAKKYPDRIAFSYKKNPNDTNIIHVTYSEARDYIRNIGTGLIHLGCRDKHVAIIGETSYEWICFYFSLMAIGAVTVPIDREISSEEMSRILNFADCEYVVYGKSIEGKIEEALKTAPGIKTVVCMGKGSINGAYNLSDVESMGKERFENGDNSYYDYEIDPDRLATIVFTSGTTGKGKGVMLSQKNIVSDMTQGMYLFSITPKTLSVLPPHHTYGSTVVFVGHFAQGSCICISCGLKHIAY